MSDEDDTEVTLELQIKIRAELVQVLGQYRTVFEKWAKRTPEGSPVHAAIVREFGGMLSAMLAWYLLLIVAEQRESEMSEIVRHARTLIARTDKGML